MNSFLRKHLQILPRANKLTVRASAFLTILWIGLISCACSSNAADAEQYDWQKTNVYVAPDFDRFFPDDPDGGKRLDELWRASNRENRPDEEILKAVRHGLRRTSIHKTDCIRWIGNRYIWNRSPQNPLAIEITYHAADFRGPNADPNGTRHYSVYFGLSVVKEKTPAILQALANLCMAVDDPNDLDRIAWGLGHQRDAFLEYLKPHLESSDVSAHSKAETVGKIMRKEMNAFAWAAERAKKRAQEKYASRLPEIREILLSGDSKQRLEILQLIRREQISLIMDDSFISAFAECAKDADPKIRNDVARIVGNQWIWSAQDQRPEAIDLMMRLSQDQSREVRYNAVYFGLSVVQKKNDEVTRRLLETILFDREHNNLSRVTWGLRGEREKAAKILDLMLKEEDQDVSKAALEIYKQVTGQEPPRIELPAPVFSEHLKPLSRLIGNEWIAKNQISTTPIGISTVRYQWQLNGVGLRSTSSVVHPEDKTRKPIAEILYAWHPQKQRIVLTGLAATGEYYEGSVTPEENALIHEWTSSSAETSGHYRRVLRFIDDNKYLETLYRKSDNGWRQLSEVEWERLPSQTHH